MRRDAGEPGVATGRLAHPEAQAAGRRHDELVGSALPLRHVDPALRHVAVPDLPRRVSCRRASTLPGSVLKTSRAWKISELNPRSEEHTSELQSRGHLVCRLLL